MRAALGGAYAASQKKHEANEMLNELTELAKRQYISAYEVAKIYVALGNDDQAFQLLAKAYAEHAFHLAPAPLRNRPANHWSQHTQLRHQLL